MKRANAFLLSLCCLLGSFSYTIPIIGNALQTYQKKEITLKSAGRTAELKPFFRRIEEPVSRNFRKIKFPKHKTYAIKPEYFFGYLYSGNFTPVSQKEFSFALPRTLQLRAPPAVL